MRQKFLSFTAVALAAGIIFGLAACQYIDPDQGRVANPKKSRGPNAGKSVFGEGGLQLFGGVAMKKPLAAGESASTVICGALH